MKFRKKPVVIEAELWSGENWDVIRGFVGSECDLLALPEHSRPDFVQELYIRTSEGYMRANIGDWIIRGVKGEFYPCKPDIFEATYDPVEE